MHDLRSVVECLILRESNTHASQGYTNDIFVPYMLYLVGCGYQLPVLSKTGKAIWLPDVNYTWHTSQILSKQARCAGTLCFSLLSYTCHRPAQGCVQHIHKCENFHE